MLTSNDVFNIIINEYKKYYESTDDKVINWFWSVGFTSISITEDKRSVGFASIPITEDKKEITCCVERPNKFIGKWNNKIVNFLVHLKENIFAKKGYKFTLSKSQNPMYTELIEILSNSKNNCAYTSTE